ncbi:MAG: alpha/beta hydrolase family protein [Candidatus Dormibacteraceae bacterium]
MEEILLEVDSQYIAARLFEPTLPNGHGIFFIHGWRSRQDSPRGYAESLTTEGFTCLTFDLRGMGESDGDIQLLSRRDYLDDCLTAYDTLASTPGVTEMSVVGSSFGAYMACIVTAYRNVFSLVLRVPANYPNEDFDKPQVRHSDALDAERWRTQERQHSDSYSLAALHRYPGKVLIVESEKDEIVHHSTVESFMRSVPNKIDVTHVIMRDAPHSLGTDNLKQQYDGILRNWFTGQCAVAK